MRPNDGCPVRGTINVIAGKCEVMILWHLGVGAKRSAELKRLLPSVSEKALTDQLRQLESDGVVRRATDGSVPAPADYSLTVAGEEVIPEMEQLCHLGFAPSRNSSHAQTPEQIEKRIAPDYFFSAKMTTSKIARRISTLKTAKNGMYCERIDCWGGTG